MQKKEPVIIAGDFNNEELYRWLVKKAESFTQLRQLHIEKTSLEERLANVKKIIAVVTNESQLEISLTDQDPTQHQDSQGS